VTSRTDGQALFDVDPDGGVLLRLHVQPGATRSEIQGTHGDALKVRIAAPPVGGAANAAVARLLADSFGIRRSDVEIVSGATSRRKRVRLAGVDARQLTAWLGRRADPRSPDRVSRAPRSKAR
jgi:hypothetical protein